MRTYRPDPQGRATPVRWRQWLLPLSATAGVLGLLALLQSGPPGLPLSYSQFLADVGSGAVRAVTIGPAGQVTGILATGQPFTTTIPVALGDRTLAGQLAAHHVQVSATAATSSSLTPVLTGLLLLLLLGALFVAAVRHARLQNTGLGGLTRAGGITKSNARVVDAERPGTRFADVAGYPAVKTEVGEVVDYLRDPARYRAAGARGPRGVLMAGPPGTGKTLLARAVAGEADVPFLSVSGSAFVEMFVGVGAARVRDLFEQARDRAPAIVFIDEIDALGARRGARGLIGNDEREQTLNQLLAEMDGFDQDDGVVVLAATNRPDALDPALRRPGRFDREVLVPLPGRAEREAILGTHTRGKNLEPDVNLGQVAAATPGFSGADLANLVNEAALTAVRAGRTRLTAADFTDARDRVVLGTRDRGAALTVEELATVAVHEAGHALVATLSPHADPVSRVTVLGAGRALGLTEQLPADDRRLYGESYLADALAVRLGGRAAELLVRGEASTGAADDLASATALATQMVSEFGLSPAVGPVSYSGTPAAPPAYSERTQWLIDRAVAALLTRAEARARELLTRHLEALHQLTAALAEQETVSGDQVRALVRPAALISPIPAAS
ncbi:MAG: ATP-dependent zinc metalloprotease FtsH [Actinobacteria bacterium]|nr:ATP-dependent zinc metalloprotease FtsH [Actinomycetota bacterium]